MTCLRIGLHRRDESVSAPRQGLDVPRTRRRISQGLPQFVHGRVQAVVEVHEGVGRPQFLAHLLACDHVAGTLSSNASTWNGCSCSRNFAPFLRSSPGSEVEFEYSKPRDSAGPIVLESGHKK